VENELKQLQQVQLNMLKLFDQICRDNNLRYSLYAGTLLGAVRHQGFIPWDDDLDVCMPREDYDRFLSLWPQIEHDGYIMQNKENTPAFTQSFSKIRKDHTTFIQEEWEKGRYHTGIFIDIFPVDRIPDGWLSRRLFWWRCMRYQLYTREFVPPKAGRIITVGSKLLLLVTPKSQRPACRRKLLQKITANNHNESFNMVTLETMRSIRQIHVADMTSEYVELPFEDGTFMCFAKWHEHLKAKFDDYMLMPPENERKTHHPLILSFEENYEELGSE